MLAEQLEIKFNQMYLLNARDIVNSGQFFAGDGDLWYDDDDEDSGDKFSSREAILDDWREIIEWKFDESKQEFVDSILEVGIATPIECSTMKDSDLICVDNGHHRIAVAYNHNLIVPVYIRNRNQTGLSYYDHNWPTLIDSDGGYSR